MTADPLRGRRWCVFTCDRTPALTRGIAAALELDPVARTLPWTVFDDSRDRKAIEQNRAVLRALQRRFRVRIEHVDRPRRQRLSVELAKRTGAPRALLEFALLGTSVSGTTVGSNRNAMLLTAAGSLAICSDDDVVPRVAAMPWQQHGSNLSEYTEEPRCLLVSSQRAAVGLVHWLPDSVLSVHERVLGRRVQEILATNASPPAGSPVSPALSQDITSGKARAVVSRVGIVGGDYRGLPILRLRQDEVRLAGSERQYRAAALATHLIEGSTRLDLVRHGGGATFHFGLDLSDPVPPFLPICRGQDGLFGSMLPLCRSDAWQATSPVGVEHARVESRPFRRAALWNNAGVVAIYDICQHFFSLAPRLASGAVALEPARAFDLLGRILLGATVGSLPQFEERMRAIGRVILGRRASYLDSFLSHPRGGPRYWREDLKRQIAHLTKWACGTHCWLPADVLPGAAREIRVQTVREVLTYYGELLCAWSGIVAAARDLDATAL